VLQNRCRHQYAHVSEVGDRFRLISVISSVIVIAVWSFDHKVVIKAVKMYWIFGKVEDGILGSFWS